MAPALLGLQQWLVVLLHPHQAELMHGEAQGSCAVTLSLGTQQFIEGSRSPGAPWGQEPTAALTGALVDPGGHLLHGFLAMENDANLVEVVVGLGGPTSDPGGLAQPKLALDDQRVGGVSAGGVPVVELVSLEEAVRVEEVGSGEELRSWPHLTPGRKADLSHPQCAVPAYKAKSLPSDTQHMGAEGQAWVGAASKASASHSQWPPLSDLRHRHFLPQM